MPAAFIVTPVRTPGTRARRSSFRIVQDDERIGYILPLDFRKNHGRIARTSAAHVIPDVH